MDMKSFYSNITRNLPVLLSGIILGCCFSSFYSHENNLNIKASMMEGITSAFSANYIPPVCGLSKMPPNDNTRGMIQTESEYASAVNSYEASHPQNPTDSVTWGGMIGKEYLMAIVNSIGSETNVYFRFATDNAMKKTSVYFVGGTTDPVTGGPAPGKLFIRTGMTQESFCPTNCR
jgi:hypothetical protein